MVSGQWDGEGLDDWEDELERPDGHPALAMLLGAIVILIVAAIALSVIPFDVTRNIARALGIAGLGAVAVFGGAWFATVRHASTGWKIAVGAAFVALALLCVVSAVGVANLAVRADIAALGKIRINADGEPEVPRGVRRGPIVQMGMTYLREMVAERHKREDLLIGKLGLDKLTNAIALEGKPELLTDCARFARAKPDLDASDKRAGAIMAKFRSSVSAAIQNEALRKEALKEMDKGFEKGGSAIKEGSALQHQQLDAAGPLCTLLARRNWRASGPMFMFTNRGDLNAFDSQIGEWNEMVKKAQELQVQANASGLEDDSRPAPRY